MSKFYRLTIALIFYFLAPSLLFTFTDAVSADTGQVSPKVTLYPAITFNIPTVNIKRKSDDTEAAFITGKTSFELLAEIDGIPLDGQGTKLVYFFGANYFTASKQETPVNESVTISHDVNTSVSGYYTYFAPTITYKSENSSWRNVIDTFGLGLGIGTGYFSGNARFAKNNKYTDSTPVSKLNVDKFFSWNGFIFIEQNFSNNWLFRITMSFIRINDNYYTGYIEEDTISIGKSFSF